MLASLENKLLDSLLKIATSNKVDPSSHTSSMFAPSEIRYLDISADKAMKFIIGGGIGSPGFIDWAGREKIEESN